MILQVKIADHTFKLSIGSGHNDWVWLSHYAAKKYSKIAYPQGMYLPTQCIIEDQDKIEYYPHPREKIRVFLEDNKLNSQKITVQVKFRKGNHTFNEFEKIWEKEAFGLERYMMNIIYILDASNLEPNKDSDKEFFFKVHFTYTMNPSVKHLFDQINYPLIVELELEQKAIGMKMCTFKGQIRLPFGTVNPELYYYRRDPKDHEIYRSQRVKDSKLKEHNLKASLMISPKYISIQETNSLVSEQMKITDNITKSIQEKELEAKKRNANSSLCCYTFEQLWRILEEDYSKELSLKEYEESTIQRIKIVIEKSLNNLYQIFFYYFIIENQQKEKKEELGITYQHVMHFLKYYLVFPDMEALQGFLEYYNHDFKFKNIKQTVDIENKSIKFPHFIAILLRSIQFLQTTMFNVKGESFDVSVVKIIDRILDIDSQEEDFGEFKRNLRQNPKIISFFRTTSETMKKIFVNQAIKSIQNSAQSYVIKKEEVKEMLELSGLTSKNTNSIVQDLFEELNLSEEGIFYYQFIEAIQWLSLALVSSDKDTMEIVENEEEEAMLIIQKIKFFIEKIEL